MWLIVFLPGATGSFVIIVEGIGIYFTDYCLENVVRNTYCLKKDDLYD